VTYHRGIQNKVSYCKQIKQIARQHS